MRSGQWRIAAVIAAAALPPCGCAAGTDAIDPGRPVAAVVVTVGSAQLKVGEQTQASAEARDATGAPVEGQQPAWSTSDASVATVSATGTVTAVHVGSADITATTQGVSGSVTVTVSATPPPPPVATTLAITTQPGGTAITGMPLSPQPIVQLRDAAGSAVARAGVVVTASIASGSGTLSGTTTATSSATGAAAFADLAITGSGAQTLLFSASGLTSASSNTITVSGGGSTATVLLTEDFEDSNFGARGWYDIPAGGITALSTAEHITGSTRSLQVAFAQGQTTATGWTAARHPLTETDAVYLRYWVKFSSNWVGSGQPYHPHEFHFLTNEDGAYVGPSSTHLTLYVEENFSSGGGSPLLQAQDAQNIDGTRVNQDLTNVTENRAVSGCNGDQDGTPSQCYQIGSDWYNGKGWKSATPVFLQNPGPGYKGDWHKVEAYFKLNSIANGKAVRDGIAQYWLDGQLVIDRHDLVLRTGLHPNMRINQFMMAPYIGDGSPVSQTLWYDDLVVMTAPPSP